MTHYVALSDESGTRTDPTIAVRVQPTADTAADLQAVPLLADLVSREIRRMGRAWKIEGTKSVLHIVLTMLVMTVLGAGWLLFIAVTAVVGWYLWSRFSVKATVKPYKVGKRRARCEEESDAADGAGDEYADWLVRSENATE